MRFPGRARRATLCAALVVPVLLGGCASDDGQLTGGDRPPVSTSRRDTTVAEPPLTAPTPTTSPTTTTVVTPTTTAPTSTAPTPTTEPRPTLPVPAPPPIDDTTTEPVVELGSIEIPSLSVTSPMYEGVHLPTFDLGAGHWPGTAMPGQFGNAVVGGHRTSHSRPFRNLDRLRAGDLVIFQTAQGRFTYSVARTEIVDPTELHVIQQKPGYTATLFACHPPGSTTERIVVHLILAESEPSGN